MRTYVCERTIVAGLKVKGDPPHRAESQGFYQTGIFGITELIRNCLRIYRWNYWDGCLEHPKIGTATLQKISHYTVVNVPWRWIMEIMHIRIYRFYAWQVTNGSWVRLRFKYDGELIDEMP